jgi:hypothetical protein
MANQKGADMLKIITTGIAIAMMAAPTLAQTSIGGHYKVEGTNLNGTTYSGEATITLTSDTTCAIEWVTGSTTSVGICMRNDASFSAAYRMDDIVGLVIYKVMADGSMNGLWTIANNGGAGTEVLTPMQ